MAHPMSIGRKGLLLVSLVPLLASLSGCLYAGRGTRVVGMEWDGQRCSPLQAADNQRNALGEDGSKLHGFGGAKRFYAACFWFKGAKNDELVFRVQSGEFQPEIMLIRRGDDEVIAQDKGSRSAQVQATLARNGDYGLVVTSIMPFETGDFEVAYSVN